MNDELMRIGELASFFNVSAKALRIYEKKGIIKPVKVDEETGYRYYSADQVKQLNALIDLQSLGFTLDEIKEIMDGDLSFEQLMEKLDAKKWEWQEKILAAQNKVDVIGDIMQRLNASAEPKYIKTMTEDERARLLVKMVCVEEVKAQHILSEAIWL